MDKLITRIKVANKCPPITHLFFSDDSLLFCKVEKEQCGAILDILKKYEAVSGQQINFAKSSVQFGHTVDEGVRTEMQGVLGITNLGGMDSYLGLPKSLGESKTQVFSFVRDKLLNRTNGWTAKLLSKGGKEVKIKSVATAVSTFVMSCFRIPKMITSKLTIAMEKFWWSTNGQSGGTHWLAWEKLCCSKQLGGLGFRNVDDFNSALLAKQLWHLIEFPDSLYARVFKGAGWICTASQDSSHIMGATNFRRSLSPLHAEVEAFIWAMCCMIGHDYRDVAFYTDCSDLVKMVSSPQD
ncbi:PREDICTED: uncharacterized protein LOC104767908 [Camelina sativa]|uniref:Uncharacterized protein LOC104767908 n=1 Tax=Camelina sativa TaxID=90675 RepID=A0ABM0XS47_CAMSA|nr:PREDICTED: uncharacterized protein LOC104767908 [Camelina sativa]